MNSRASRKRRGATTLEMAIVLGVFLTLTMGMLDLGIGVFRYHILANAARHGARQAIVHGAMASALGVWGPSTINVAANTSAVPIIDGANGLRPLLIGCNLAATQVRVEWPNGNEVEDPVTVTVTSPYQPIMLFIFPNVPKTLSASSTMRIAH
jgi:Flp pilus assembly protein TadG